MIEMAATLGKGGWNSLHNVSKRGLSGQAPPVVFLSPVIRERIFHHQLSRGGGEAHTVLGHTGEGAGVLREDLLDDEGRHVVIVVVNLEVWRGFDDGCLPEPGDLGPGISLNLADKLNLGAIWGSLGLHLLGYLRSESFLVSFWL